MKRALIRVLLGIGALVAVVMLGRTALAAWGDLQATTIRVDWLRAAAATAWLAASLMLPILLWRRLLALAGARVAFVDAIQLWSFANLGRYVPGKIWQLMATVSIAREFAVPVHVSAPVATAAVGLQLLTGLLVSSPLAFASAPTASWKVALTLAIAVALSGIALRLVLRGRWGRRLRNTRFGAVLGLGSVGGLTLVGVGFVGVWIAQGMGLFLLCRAFAPVGFGDLGGIVSAYSWSYVLGLVAVFAPGGIGIREEALVRSLQLLDLSGIPVAVLAISARLWAVAAEVLVLVVAIVLRGRAHRARRA